jgi:hypothetical protein
VKPRRDRIKNTNFWVVAQAGGNSEPIQGKEAEMFWTRMDEKKTPKRLLEMKMNRRRPRGRPCI